MNRDLSLRGLGFFTAVTLGTYMTYLSIESYTFLSHYHSEAKDVDDPGLGGYAASLNQLTYHYSKPMLILGPLMVAACIVGLIMLINKCPRGAELVSVPHLALDWVMMAGLMLPLWADNYFTGSFTAIYLGGVASIIYMGAYAFGWIALSCKFGF